MSRKLTVPKGGLDIEKAARWIAECKSLNELKDFRDQATAVSHYLRARHASLEAQQDAAEAVVLADRRLGQLLPAVTKGKGGKRGNQHEASDGVSLADLGITKKQSSRCQKLAQMPAGKFKSFLISTRAAGERATTNGALAAVSAEAGYDGDEWYTPAEFIEAARDLMDGIDLDPASNAFAQKTVKAARYFTKKDDGLAHDWEGKVWLNPPYSYPLVEQFCEKFEDEYNERRMKQGILLVNNCTDAAWCQALLKRFPACFSDGRVAFSRRDGVRFATRQGQIFFYAGRRVTRFIDVFSAFGTVMEAR